MWVTNIESNPSIIRHEIKGTNKSLDGKITTNRRIKNGLSTVYQGSVKKIYAHEKNQWIKNNATDCN
jgi:hypothetical protein